MPTPRTPRDVVREAQAALRAADRRAALEREADLLDRAHGITHAIEPEQPELVNEPEQIIEEPAAVFEVPAAAMAIPEGPELYHRQASFNLGHPRVMIVGCGGVGVWAALALALGGAKALELYDGDTLSLHNLNRFPLPASKVGELKSVALASWLRSLRPECKIRAHGMLDPSLEPVDRVVDWVVCSTDSLKSRQLARNVALGQATEGRGTQYLELGADGERWSLTAEPPEFSTELEEQAGYATVPVHVGPCMMAGAAAAYYVLHGQTPRETLQGDWTIEPNRQVSHLALRSYSEEDTPVPAMEMSGLATHINTRLAIPYTQNEPPLRMTREMYTQLMGGRHIEIIDEAEVPQWQVRRADPEIPPGTYAAINRDIMWQNYVARLAADNPLMRTQLTNVTVPGIPEADRERGTLTVEEVAHAFDEIRRGEDEQT